MEFVDRKEETLRLKEAYTKEKPSFIVIYGRRRLGKSTLIKKTLSKGDLYFLADTSEKGHQILLLAKVIAQLFPEFDKAEYHDWESLLRALNYRANKRFTLCLDEFPFLIKQAPELSSVLQKLLDEKKLKFNLVLCGSSQNMMYGLVLDATAPLYGRADVILRLSPIRLPYLQRVFGLTPVQTIEEYSVWGGVPRYWELREGRAGLTEALWHNILSVSGTLYEEPAKLFQDDIQDIVKTSTIMSYIGGGANRLAEIASRFQKPATDLSRPLKKLVDLGFLEREIPFDVDERNNKKSLYKISDPFMAFYYRFAVPNRSFIELGRKAPVERDLEAHFQEYTSLWWEKLCRDAVTGNAINGVLYGKARRWWGRVINEYNKPEQVEFDVVAESLDKKNLIVGECKWTTIEDGNSLTNSLLRKAKLLPFSKGHKIVPILFLKNAPKNDLGNVLLPEDIIQLFCECTDSSAKVN